MYLCMYSIFLFPPSPSFPPSLRMNVLLCFLMIKSYSIHLTFLSCTSLSRIVPLLLISHPKRDHVLLIPWDLKWPRTALTTLSRKHGISLYGEFNMHLYISLSFSFSSCFWFHFESFLSFLSFSRLKTNVRLVLSLPDLSLASSCGLLEMKNLLSVIEVCYELAWDRKRLLHVANYHLKSKREEGRGWNGFLQKKNNQNPLFYSSSHFVPSLTELTFKSHSFIHYYYFYCIF